jgi:hypothetical protein
MTSFLLSAVLVWAIYRRVRRNFGPQPVNVGRMRFRIAVLALVGALVLIASARNVELLGALIGGMACGLVLGYFGLLHTKIEVTPQGRFYTPHTYIGLFVTALFLGRVLFRFLTVHPDAYAMTQSHQSPFDAYQRSPLTVAMFGVLLGYYAYFTLGVLRKSRDLAVPATDTPKS